MSEKRTRRLQQRVWIDVPLEEDMCLKVGKGVLSVHVFYNDGTSSVKGVIPAGEWRYQETTEAGTPYWESGES